MKITQQQIKKSWIKTRFTFVVTFVALGILNYDKMFDKSGQKYC
jgi:uncharacterized membrane protein SirB2